MTYFSISSSSFYLFFLSEYSVISKCWEKLWVHGWGCTMLPLSMACQHHSNDITFLAGAQCNSISLSSKLCFSLSPHSLSGSWPDPRPLAKGIRQGERTEKQCSLCSPTLSGRSSQVSSSFSEEGSQSQNNLSRQCWRSRRRPEGQIQLTPFPHPKEKSVRRKFTASLSLILDLLW